MESLEVVVVAGSSVPRLWTDGGSLFTNLITRLTRSEIYATRHENLSSRRENGKGSRDGAKILWGKMNLLRKVKLFRFNGHSTRLLTKNNSS